MSRPGASCVRIGRGSTCDTSQWVQVIGSCQGRLSLGEGGVGVRGRSTSSSEEKVYSLRFLLQEKFTNTWCQIIPTLGREGCFGVGSISVSICRFIRQHTNKTTQKKQQKKIWRWCPVDFRYPLTPSSVVFILSSFLGLPFTLAVLTSREVVGRRFPHFSSFFASGQCIYGVTVRVFALPVWGPCLRLLYCSMYRSLRKYTVRRKVYT